MKAKIEYCYESGKLAGALEQAQAFVAKVGEEAVLAILTNHDDQAGWYVYVFTSD